MRITKEKLRQRIERLQQAGFDIEIGWAYGQPRITNKSESRDLSPRLPMSAMNEWIDGFETGAGEHERKRLICPACDSKELIAKCTVCSYSFGTATK